MKEIAVVVLSWNALSLLERYLPSLVQHTPSNLADIYLADNGSSDGSVDYAKHMGLKVILLGKNYGFAEGYNKTIQQLTHPYILLLNNDVRVTAGWLEPLYVFIHSHKDVVSVQPKVRWDREPERYEYAGAEGGYLDFLGYPFCRGRLFDMLELDSGQYGSEPKEVFWTTGAAMLVRREAFVSAGGFDESFFAHQEEIDLCWRWKALGHKLFVVPQSVVFHYGGASLSSLNPQKTFLNFRNNRLMLSKNLPRSKRSGILITRVLLDLIAAIKFALEGRMADVKALFRAMSEYRFATRRSPLTEEEKERAYQCLYQHPLLWRYHICGEKTFSKLKK